MTSCRADGKNTDLDPTTGDESAVDAVVAVVGRRRGSCRRFETPASRLKEELDFPYFELLEKLCLVELARENMLALTPPSCHVQCRECFKNKTKWGDGDLKESKMPMVPMVPMVPIEEEEEKDGEGRIKRQRSRVK
jgi:hypothetical protein